MAIDDGSSQLSTGASFSNPNYQWYTIRVLKSIRGILIFM